VKNRYSYKPFGELFEAAGEDETEEYVSNPFKFTSQYHDHEINECYLRARMYDPMIHRFTSRDPVCGKFKEPMTLHVYLYCLNDPINRIDPEGKLSALVLVNPMLTGVAFYGHTISLAAYAVSSEDWRFFDLTEATAKFTIPAMGLAATNPLGPYGRIAAYFGEGTIEEVWASRTGFTWEEALAIDVAAYAGYYG